MPNPVKIDERLYAAVRQQQELPRWTTLDWLQQILGHPPIATDLDTSA